MNKEKIEKLIKMGAKRWTMLDMDRLYLNNAGIKLSNIYCKYRHTGSIEEAFVNGVSVSNNKARKMKNKVGDAYIDLKTDELIMETKYEEDEDLKRIVEENLKTI
ncbi:hypothetical protein [Anaerococcus senegalensis]|uniref:hypothetical protein n=1 Tax=Anaerococcus senegalensis TaxID=1288120 RepID=UPI000307E6D1|nr:hypothetical protein [Anaerococcus senegalensis]